MGSPRIYVWVEPLLKWCKIDSIEEYMLFCGITILFLFIWVVAFQVWTQMNLLKQYKRLEEIFRDDIVQTDSNHSFAIQKELHKTHKEFTQKIKNDENTIDD